MGRTTFIGGTGPEIGRIYDVEETRTSKRRSSRLDMVERVNAEYNKTKRLLIKKVKKRERGETVIFS